MSEAAEPWYQGFFGSNYLDVYGNEFAADRAEREVAFVSETLGLRPGDRVLDLCCGQGRHAVLLARNGLQVTAQDLSVDYLALAQAAAAAAGVSIEAVNSDMRQIPFEGHFDAVINMFTAFGYLESEAEDAKVLHAAAAALKPGRRLLLDLLNREWVIQNYVPDELRTGADGTTYLEHREFDLRSSRNHVTFTTVAPDGSQRELDGHHVRLYTLTEVIKLLEAAGLAFKTAYGGFGGESYSLETRRMIVVARKSGG